MKILFLLLALAAPLCAVAQELPSVVVFNIQSKAGVGQEIGDTGLELGVSFPSSEGVKYFISITNRMELI